MVKLVITPNKSTKKAAYVVVVEYKNEIDKKEAFRKFIAAQVDLWDKIEKWVPVDTGKDW